MINTSCSDWVTLYICGPIRCQDRVVGPIRYQDRVIGPIRCQDTVSGLILSSSGSYLCCYMYDLVYGIFAHKVGRVTVEKKGVYMDSLYMYAGWQRWFLVGNQTGVICIMNCGLEISRCSAWKQGMALI